MMAEFSYGPIEAVVHHLTAFSVEDRQHACNTPWSFRRHGGRPFGGTFAVTQRPVAQRQPPGGQKIAPESIWEARPK